MTDEPGNGTVRYSIRELLERLDVRLAGIELRLSAMEKRQEVYSAFVTTLKWLGPVAATLVAGAFYFLK
jgi:hypothetical protein